MPDPRNTLAFDGIREDRVSYKADGTTITYAGRADAIGKAVTVSGNGGVVSLTSDGDAVLGKLVAVEADGTVSVQDVGYALLPGGASATLTRGTKIVGALGASSAKGYIRSVNTAAAAELGKCIGQIIDSANPAKTLVSL